MYKPTTLISVSHSLAKFAFSVCVISQFLALIVWAICDGRGVLPYALMGLIISGWFAKQQTAAAIKSSSANASLIAWIPLILNCLLVFFVSGNIKSCH